MSQAHGNERGALPTFLSPDVLRLTFPCSCSAPLLAPDSPTYCCRGPGGRRPWKRAGCWRGGGRCTCGRLGRGALLGRSARSSPPPPLGVSLGCRAGWAGSADSRGWKPCSRAPAPSVSSAAVGESTRSSAIAGAT